MLLALFAVAFISATLWPTGSELLFVVMIRGEGVDWVPVWLVATLGNTLGALAMLALARWVSGKVDHPWAERFKPSAKARAWLDRYGSPALVLAWLPIVGDLLPVAAGWLRLSLPASLLWLTLGKGLRFGVLAWFVL